ncbi:MAG: hypothetical protein MHM6MM_003557 [Cercozoa sp. M6MM]
MTCARDNQCRVHHRERKLKRKTRRKEKKMKGGGFDSQQLLKQQQQQQKMQADANPEMTQLMTAVAQMHEQTPQEEAADKKVVEDPYEEVRDFLHAETGIWKKVVAQDGLCLVLDPARLRMHLGEPSNTPLFNGVFLQGDMRGEMGLKIQGNFDVTLGLVFDNNSEQPLRVRAQKLNAKDAVLRYGDIVTLHCPQGYLCLDHKGKVNFKLPSSRRISAWRLVDPRLLPKMPETQLVWWQHPPLKKPPHLWLQWPLLPSVGERDNCSCRHTESHQKRPHKPRAKFRHYTDPASDLNKATDLSVMEQLVCAEAATLQTAQPLLKQHASLLPFTQYPLLKESDKDKFERTQYQRELRQESILVLSNANPRQRQLFDELAFDISARVHEVSHDAQFSADRVSAARALLRLGKKVKVARDEIYAQLVVHTINNPSQSSRRALWITVFLALSTFPPSPPMRAFMMSEAAAQSDKFLWHRDPHSPGSAAGLAFLALKFGHAANPKIAAISTKATRAAFAVCAQKLSLLLHVQGGDMAVSVDARMSDSLHEVARKAAFALGLETGGEGVAMCDRMRVSIETDFALLTRLLKQWTGRATVFHVVHMINLARAKRPFLRVKWRLALWHWGMLDDLPSVDLRMLHLMYGTAYDEWRRGEWSAVSPEASEQLATFALLISTNGAPSGAQNRLTPTYLASMLPRSMCGDVRRLTRVLLRRIRAVHIAVAPTDVSKANESEEEQSVLPPGQRFRVSSLMNRFLSIAKESEDFGWTRFAARTSDLVVISLHTKRGVRVHRLLSDGTVAQQLGAAPSVNALGNVTVNDDKSVVVRECALLDTDVMLIRCPRTFAAVVGDFQQRG